MRLFYKKRVGDTSKVEKMSSRPQLIRARGGNRQLRCYTFRLDLHAAFKIRSTYPLNT
jgi:hypothetical protein